MIEGLKPYAEYKETGHRWLGNIPAHWEMRKLKHLTRFINGLPFKPSDWCDCGVAIIRIQNLNGSSHFNYTRRRDLPDSLRIRPGELLFAWSGNRGTSFGPFLWNRSFDGYLNQHIFKLAGYSLETRYFAALLRVVTTHIEEEKTHGIIGLVHVTKPELSGTSVPVASPDEQAAIVRFLDHANRKIDCFICSKRKLIGLLNEQKQAIIHRAVIRGLDPEVPLKPSGIPWLGDIPKHWEVRRAKYLFREVDDRSKEGKETHLAMSQRLGLVPSSMVESAMRSESYAGAKLCQEGDLVLNRLKAHLGVFALAKQGGVISPDYSVFRKRTAISMEYYESILKSSACRRELRIRAKGLVEGFWRLYTDDFYDIRLPVPPLDEQREIMSAMTVETAALNTVIARTEQEIALMQEYRTRLTADLVTGKLDVREAAATLPELANAPSAEPATDEAMDEIEENEE